MRNLLQCAPLEEFAEYFVGFSISSPDLRQLTLGVVRDSDIVAPLFDEGDANVERFVLLAIQVAKATGRRIGICGQAPSDSPEFTRFLLEQGKPLAEQIRVN